MLQHAVTHHNALQHTATYCNTQAPNWYRSQTTVHMPTPCNTLRHFVTHCDTIAICCKMLQQTKTHCNATATHRHQIGIGVRRLHMYYMGRSKFFPLGVLHCVVVCCSVLQCDTVCCSVLQCVAVRCSVLQCVAACCSVLQCV